MNRRESEFARKAQELANLRANYEVSAKDHHPPIGAPGKYVMPYRDYMRSDLWKKKRFMALKRANFRCQGCNRGGALEVHHLTYEQLGKEQIRQLLVLCRPCHQNQHDSMTEDQKQRLMASIPQPPVNFTPKGSLDKNESGRRRKKTPRNSPGNRYSGGPVGAQGKRPFAENAVSVTDPRRGMR